MDVYTQWGKTIKEAVRHYAKSEPKQSREDFEQDCFVRVLELRDNIDRIQEEQGDSAAARYVHVICRHKVWELLETENKRRQFEVPLDDRTMAKELEQATRQTLDLGISEEELDEAVKKLSREDQHVVRSIYFQGVPERELVKTLNIPKTSLHRLKTQAISQLREILGVK